MTGAGPMARMDLLGRSRKPALRLRLTHRRHSLPRLGSGDAPSRPRLRHRGPSRCVDRKSRAPRAEYGAGDAVRYSQLYDDGFRDLLDDARAPSLGELGDDAVRFSSQPALGGTGYIIALSATGRAEVSWFWGHASLGWRRTRRVRFDVSEDEYREVIAEVDQLLAVGIADAQNDARQPGEVIVACADGPGYLAERIRDGESFWLRPQCSGVNRDIATYLKSWAFTHLGR